MSIPLMLRKAGPFILGLALLTMTACSATKTSWEPIAIPADVDPPYLILEQIVDGQHNEASGRFAGLKQKLFGQTLASALVRPTDMTIDSRGRLLVVDSEISKIVIFEKLDEKWNWVESLRPAGIHLPLSIAAGPDRVYVTDVETGHILIYDNEFNKVNEIEHENFVRPGDLCFCGQRDRLFVADPAAHRVFIFSGTGEYLAQVGREGRGAALLHYPMSITVNPEKGEFHVLDGIARKVKRYSSDFDYLGSFGEYDQVPGTLAFPKGIAQASDETLFIADAAFGNIQMFDPNGALLLFLGGTGSDPGQYVIPRNLYLSPQQKLYVADPYNSRIQIYQYNPQP